MTVVDDGPTIVDIYTFDLDVPTTRVAALEPLLDADERARAERFHFDRHRLRYIVGRATLRSILGAEIGIAPAEVRLVVTSHGRPLLDPSHGHELRFNLAHSEGIAVLGVTTSGAEIGVDVEVIRPGFADDEIAERFFSPPEVTTLRALAPNAQEAAFFRCWTRKEAYLKALGGGLSFPLDDFGVAFAPGDAPALVWSRLDDPTAWSMVDLAPLCPGCAAATIVRGARPAIRHHKVDAQSGAIASSATPAARELP